jgi:mediator of RNA polymerase II transcription subunit 17
MAGTGTLGMDKIQASRVTDAQKEDNRRVAKGWKIQNLNKTVDTILESATRLEKEMETETKYWEQVLAVSDSGWAVCRLPNEKHTLGVRFGFSECKWSLSVESIRFINKNSRTRLQESKPSRSTTKSKWDHIPRSRGIK